MRTIATLKGADFLRACNNVRKKIEPLLKDISFAEIRVAAADASDEAANEAAKKTLDNLIDKLLDEKAEQTYALIETLCIRETDEEIDGVDMLSAALDLLEDQRVVNFLLRLMR